MQLPQKSKLSPPTASNEYEHLLSCSGTRLHQQLTRRPPSQSHQISLELSWCKSRNFCTSTTRLQALESYWSKILIPLSTTLDLQEAEEVLEISRQKVQKFVFFWILVNRGISHRLPDRSTCTPEEYHYPRSTLSLCVNNLATLQIIADHCFQLLKDPLPPMPNLTELALILNSTVNDLYEFSKSFLAMPRLRSLSISGYTIFIPWDFDSLSFRLSFLYITNMRSLVVSFETFLSSLDCSCLKEFSMTECYTDNSIGPSHPYGVYLAALKSLSGTSAQILLSIPDSIYFATSESVLALATEEVANLRHLSTKFFYLSISDDLVFSAKNLQSLGIINVTFEFVSDDLFIVPEFRLKALIILGHSSSGFNSKRIANLCKSLPHHFDI